MPVAFGEFELDRERRQLLRSGEPVPLEPKAYELLSLLLERRPRALSRAQIRDAVWPQTFISESTLAVTVNAIRQALDDDARHPRFIRTVHGFGYAFCGEVSEVQSPRTIEDSPSIRDGSGVGTNEAGARDRIVELPLPSRTWAARRRLLRWGAAGGLIVALAVGMWWWSRQPPEASSEPVRVTPLTTDGGFKLYPQLSPDGERVGYVWAGPTEDNWDIYVKALGVGTRPLRITDDPRDDFCPVWSPDGRQIAFARRAHSGSTLFSIIMVPSLGGQERKLADADLYGPYDRPSLSWSPDGRWLAFAEDASEQGPARIVLLSLLTLEKEPLTSPRDGTVGDLYPAFSPDGTQVAFVRSESGRDTRGDRDLWVQTVGGSDARRLTFEEYDECKDLAWTPGSRDILFSAGPFDVSRIFRVNAAGGRPRLVAGLGQWASAPSVSGSRLVHVQVSRAERGHIFRVPWPSASQPDHDPQILVESSGADFGPVYSPDGQRIAFGSTRKGPFNIWVSDIDGSHPLQLTDFEKRTGSPSWSPDGRKIAFDSVEAGDWNIYVIAADGGVARRLTPEGSSDYRGVWSRDGRWIYFASDRGGHSQIWKIPSTGGPAVQVTRGGAVYAEVSADDRELYFAKSEYQTGIWRVPVGGGEETEVVRGPIAQAFEWTVSGTRLVYATKTTRARREEYTIHSFDLESGEVTELFHRTGPFFHESLAVSPDGTSILFGESGLYRSELMLVENFR